MPDTVNDKLRGEEYPKELNSVIIDKSYGESIAEGVFDEVEANDKIDVQSVEGDSASARNWRVISSNRRTNRLKLGLSITHDRGYSGSSREIDLPRRFPRISISILNRRLRCSSAYLRYRLIKYSIIFLIYYSRMVRCL